jgi:hypothetical protein
LVRVEQNHFLQRFIFFFFLPFSYLIFFFIFSLLKNLLFYFSFTDYCKKNSIHHVASINVTTMLIPLLNKYFSYKSFVHGRKSILKYVKLFQDQLMKDFYIVWNRNPITGEKKEDDHLEIVGERIKGDVDMKALWYEDNKCGWMWVRVGRSSHDQSSRSIKSSKSLLQLRSGEEEAEGEQPSRQKRNSSFGDERRLSTRSMASIIGSKDSPHGGSTSGENQMTTLSTVDSMEWQLMYVNMNSVTGNIGCYASISDCVTTSVEPNEEITIDSTAIKYINKDYKNKDTITSAMVEQKENFNPYCGIYTDENDQMSCLLPDGCTQSVIIQKNGNVFIFGKGWLVVVVNFFPFF